MRGLWIRLLLCGVVAGAASHLGAPHAAFAAEPTAYLNVKLDGTLTPKVRAALNQLLSPSLLETIIAEQADKAIPLPKLCSRYECNDNIKEIIGGGSVGKFPTDAFDQFKGVLDKAKIAPGTGISVPTILIRPRDLSKTMPYAVDPSWSPTPVPEEKLILLAPSSPLYQAYSSPLTVGEAPVLAVEIPDNLPTFDRQEGSVVFDLKNSWDTNPSVAFTWFKSSENYSISLLQDDVSVLGSTSRQFALDREPSKDEIEKLNALAVKERVPLTVDTTLEPKIAFEIFGSEPDILQSEATGSCAAGVENWPFSSEKVLKRIQENRALLAAMGLSHLRRSQILVVDTGLGAGLAKSPTFQSYLAPDPLELLFSEIYYPDLSSTEITSSLCLDADGRSFESDAFGYSPNGKIGCQSKPPIDRVAPIPKLDGDRQPPYLPGHGSIVGVLSAGGPDLITDDSGIDDLLGLSFARITRKPPADSGLSIKTETADLGKALDYAVDREFDIVNASIKVSDQGEREQILVPSLENFKGLLVGAAGNKPIKLTEDSGNFPAAVTGKLRDEEHLIIVGAVGPSSDNRWWAHSAYSDELVDIAAPGVEIPSLDEEGRRVCISGTSAAAPMVTFTAAVLQAFGLNHPAEIRRRILATAELDSALTKKVTNGRVLDILSALDVFVDLIWLDGQSDPIRTLLIRPDHNHDKPLVHQLCMENSGILDTTGGQIDPSVLVLWKRSNDSQAEIWHRKNIYSNRVSSAGRPCTIQDATKIAYLNLSTGDEDTAYLREVDRIVPSPFRSASRVVLQAHGLTLPVSPTSAEHRR